MGQQSLYIKNRSQIIKTTKKELLEDSDKRYLKKHFLLGKEINKDKVKHNLLIEYALNTINCEIIDWVWYKINGAMKENDRQNYRYNCMLPEKANINVKKVYKYTQTENVWEKVEW